jgi:hypothetical protein
MRIFARTATFIRRHSGARPKAASPESIIPALRSMDSGSGPISAFTRVFDALWGRPGMTADGFFAHEATA